MNIFDEILYDDKSTAHWCNVAMACKRVAQKNAQRNKWVNEDKAYKSSLAYHGLTEEMANQLISQQGDHS